jgi:flagellar basal-body rod modification protein FlgD
MQTNSSTSAGSRAGAAADPAPPVRTASTETADMFTKLLVAQIQNQDPLSPSDPSQFVNQLAQLSQTEALQNLAKLSGASASVLQNMQLLAMGAQVGSTVSVSTSTVKLDDHKVDGQITLDSASASNDLVLTGADGVKHTVALGAHAAGTLAFSLDPAVLGLAPGTYSIEVKSANGTAPVVEIAGRLDSVRVSPDGSVVLKVANVGDVGPGDVIGFNGKSGGAAIASL